MPRLIAVRVVSFPATASRMKNGAISCGARMSSSSARCHERGGEVVGRVLAALLGELVHQRRELHARFEHRRHRIAHRRASGSPAPRMTFVASSTVRNSLRGMPIMSQMTSSGNGCESDLDEVDLALLAHAVDHLGADRLDRFEHRRELARRERARDDAALASVARVVHVDERPEELQGLRRQVGNRHGPLPEQKSSGAG